MEKDIQKMIEKILNTKIVNEYMNTFEYRKRQAP